MTRFLFRHVAYTIPDCWVVFTVSGVRFKRTASRGIQRIFRA